MALLEIIKWEMNQHELCYKFPSENLHLGSQLVVYSAQRAFFIKGGEICDEFSTGTHTIKVENLPILDKLINLPFGGSTPFNAEVWFVNCTTKLDLKWGTPTPIQLEDPKYHIIIPIRAFGQFGIKITNPRLFLQTLIGNLSTFKISDIESYFRGHLITYFTTLLSKIIIQNNISFLDINSYLIDLSEQCNNEISNFFETKYGVSIIDFSIMSISTPQDDPSFSKLKAIKANLAHLNLAGRDIYQMERSFDILEKAASVESIGTSLTGIGMGMGMGSIMNDITTKTINLSPPPPQDSSWFIYLNGQQIGGHTTSHISALIQQGTINAETLVWKVGMPSWCSISNVPELSNLLNITPPPVTLTMK